MAKDDFTIEIARHGMTTLDYYCTGPENMQLRCPECIRTENEVNYTIGISISKS